jgi:hypothetical protein
MLLFPAAEDFAFSALLPGAVLCNSVTVLEIESAAFFILPPTELLFGLLASALPAPRGCPFFSSKIGIEKSILNYQGSFFNLPSFVVSAYCTRIYISVIEKLRQLIQKYFIFCSELLYFMLIYLPRQKEPSGCVKMPAKALLTIEKC